MIQKFVILNYVKKRKKETRTRKLYTIFYLIDSITLTHFSDTFLQSLSLNHHILFVGQYRVPRYVSRRINTQEIFKIVSGTSILFTVSLQHLNLQQGDGNVFVYRYYLDFLE